MKSGLAQFLKNRWLTLVIHVGLWALLYFAITSLTGKTTEYRDITSVSAPLESVAPVAKLANLFAPTAWPNFAAETNSLDPFFTRHFIPPPTPAPPPPPTSRKIELTYQGFYEPADGSKHVIVKLADSFLVVPVGTKLTANLFASQANMQSLTLTNPAAQTNLLLLNTKKEIEVPIQ